MEQTKAQYRSVTLRLGFALIFQFALMRLIGWQGESILSLLGLPADYTVSGILDCFLYLFSFMIPVLFFRLISGKKHTETMKLGIKITPDAFLLIPAGMAAVSALGIVNSILVSWVDFSVVYGDYYITSAPETVLEFISTAVVPAVAEEFLYRGCVLENLRPYGRQQAIFISAFTFALMHGNFPQFLYAFAGGLVLGYCYLETGSVWTCIFLHLFNNFSSVISEIAGNIGGDYFSGLFYYAFEALIFIGGLLCLCVFIIRRKGQLLTPAPQDEKYAGISTLGRFCTSPTVIIFICLCIIRAFRILLYALSYYE